MSSTPVHVGAWRAPDIRRIKPGHATRPVLIGKAAANGTRFHALTASQTAATANTLKLYLARLMNVAQGAAGLGTFSDMGAATLTATTLTRATGDFLADGWRADSLAILTGATTLANDVAASVVSVTSTVLTFAASTFGTAEALPATAQLYHASGVSLSTLAASAGNAAGVPALDLLSDNKPFMDASPNRNLILGAGGAMFASVGTTMATGLFAELVALGGDY